MTLRFVRRALPCLIALGPAAACGGDGGGPTPPDVRIPTAIAIVAGNNQTGLVGATLGQPISVLVSDARGPIPGVTVTFTVIEGGGSALPPSRQTDATGVAATGWQLGTQVNQAHLIRASVTGLNTTATFTAVATAGPAAIVSPISGVGQFAVVSTAVAQPPRVQIGDAFGNPVAGIAVTFSIAAGDGSIVGATAVSDAAGAAQVGGWTLGPAPGANTLRATIPAGGFADILAIGTAASLQVQSGNGQVANAGTVVPSIPTVRALDAVGAPLAGVSVTFSVIEGGGTVTGATAVTNAAGQATPTAWALGLTPGANRLSATAPGVPPVIFTATGVPGTPATLADETAGPLTAFLGNFLVPRPRVILRDAQGAPVAGAPVVFDVVAGGGQVFGGTAVTDANGRAEALAWRLGQAGATQSLRVTTPGLAPITIEATATTPPVQGDYAIELRFLGTEPSDGMRAAFNSAVERWQRVILGDLPLEPGPIPATGSLCEAVNEDVDDLVIFVRLETIDGPGGVLGSAGPCWVRDQGFLTIVGGMRFDIADLATLEANGQLQSVMLHEMGHVLGIGTLWRLTNLLVGFQSADPFFTGASARTVFPTLFGSGAFYPGTPVPVENIGGPGTRDGHWRESILRNELMTGTINPGANPLSALSLASLRDLGYLVDDSVADFFELLPSVLAAPGGGAGLTLPPASREPIRIWPSRR